MKETFKQLKPEKKHRVLDAAAGLFSKKGFHQTEMAQIAARAGVAKGSLYNYFDSKEDLYLAACRDGLDQWRTAVYGDLDHNWDVYAQIDHVFRRGWKFALDHPEYIRLYINASSPGLEDFAGVLAPEIETFFADYFKRLLRRGIERGRVAQDVNVNLAAFLINSLLFTFIVALVSPYWRLRMRNYLEVDPETEDEDREFELHYARVIRLIRGFLQPDEMEPE